MNYIYHISGYGENACKRIITQAELADLIIAKDEVPKTKGVIFRWGHYRLAPKKTVNTTNAVHTAIQKYNARIIMQKCGVKVPQTSLDIKDIESDCIIAREMEHERNNGFIKLNSLKDLKLLKRNVQYYYSEFFDKDKEFRVIVGHGKILTVHEKPINKQTGVCLNHEDWKYIEWDDYISSVCKQALLAVKSLGLDFGGVDVMYKNDDSALVCEVNTCPSIYNNYIASRFAKYFKWIIRHTKNCIYPKHNNFETQTKFNWSNKELAN